VGGGIEGALWGNWTAKAEYLYMDLGTVTSSFNGVVTTSPATVSTTSAIRDHIVRFGLNYRFGGGAAGSGAMAYAGGGMQDYAADAAAMPIRSYAMPTMYSWTGPYVGVNFGYSSGNDRTTGTLSAPTTGGVLEPFGESVAAPKGVLGGAQVGYNWQGGANWLVGFEADIQGSDQTDTVCTSPLCSNIINLVGPPTSIASTIEQDLKWFATFRARAGLVRNDFLLYVTGGAALAQITEIDTFAQNTGAGSIVSASSQFTSDKAGWVVGVGAEAALWGNLTGKVEYLFLDLGNLSNSFNFNLTPGNPVTFSTTSTVRDHIFRAGLNYRFGEAAAPISTRY
jgi:outer membrane immunogenic protein